MGERHGRDGPCEKSWRARRRRADLSPERADHAFTSTSGACIQVLAHRLETSAAHRRRDTIRRRLRKDCAALKRPSSTARRQPRDARHHDLLNKEGKATFVKQHRAEYEKRRLLHAVPSRNSSRSRPAARIALHEWRPRTSSHRNLLACACSTTPARHAARVLADRRSFTLGCAVSIRRSCARKIRQHSRQIFAAATRSTRSPQQLLTARAVTASFPRRRGRER